MTADILVEMTDAELVATLGAGNGVFHTISHECYYNSWAFIFTCC